MAAMSIASSGSDTLDAWTKRSQPKIEIELMGQTPGLVSSYTTGDHIDGTATITVSQETRFDEIEIIFQGTSQTTVERTSCPGRTGSQQMFLKLRQPIDETEYPTPRVLETGRSYRFPFTFVVPERLLPQVCTHPKKNPQIERSHTMIPPTLGDPMLASNGKTLLDDMAPDMSRIGYIVRVVVLKRLPEHRQIKPLAAVAKKVRIVPSIEEEPPINLADHSAYCAHKEKTVKRGLLRGKLGRLVVTSSQPKPIQLLAPSGEPSDTVSTVATVDLRFDPVGDEPPPKLWSMSSKLRASTFYSVAPWDEFPRQSGSVPFSQIGRGLYTNTVPISTMCVASAQWAKHSPATDPRRDSTSSSSSEDCSASSNSHNNPNIYYYTASLVIPITLPESKAFVPTFHSCLISRIYALDLCLSYHTPAANLLTPTVSLRVPVQITSRSKSAESLKSSLGMTVTQEELDAFFSPRNVSPPLEFPEPTPVRDVAVGDDLAPPGYSETSNLPAPPRVRAVN
ncbi:hypothetical protein NUU61_008331 [Penicillium alfredii]|uniref:Arrestin-like N-terminal domain-containing protein n=1 Tax=Penicillium alfredii TaxID=1506179 RepID=A0A9W9ESF5_9EURO|nr:uncharacterized protein NUU61_008331 [Penicillium alfredii]KAJ5087024.1 hypothetical protein NUU61_008331 [Penicillium alfredii]